MHHSNRFNKALRMQQMLLIEMNTVLLRGRGDSGYSLKWILLLWSENGFTVDACVRTLKARTYQRLSVGQCRLVCLLCFSRQLSSGSCRRQFACWIGVGAIGTVGERKNSDWMFSLANESVLETYSESDENKHVNEGVQTEGCLNVTWSFPIILIRKCFHNNMSA